MGIIPPAITSFVTSAVVGYLLYLYGKRQGEKSKEIVTNEIKTYIKGEFLTDLTSAVRDQLNGILGPIGRAGSKEAQDIAAQYARDNPKVAGLLGGIAVQGGARWLGKQLGVPKTVVDALVGGPVNPMQGFHIPSKKDPELQPVKVPGGGPV